MEVKIGEDGLPINEGEMDEDAEGMDGEGMDGEEEKKEEGEGEGMDGEKEEAEKEDEEKEEAEKEDEEGGDASNANLSAAVDGEEAGHTESGAIKKAAGKSKSPSKGKKKKTDEKIVLVTWKPSAKVKGRLIVEEKISNPEEIIQYITDNFEFGIETLEIEPVQQLVHKMYTKLERKKLSRFFEQEKAKVMITTWHKMLIHMAFNIGPSKGVNDDIEEVNEDEKEDVHENAGPGTELRLEESPVPLEH